MKNAEILIKNRQKKYLASGLGFFGHLGHVVDDLGLLSPAKFDEQKRKKRSNKCFWNEFCRKIDEN